MGKMLQLQNRTEHDLLLTMEPNKIQCHQTGRISLCIFYFWLMVHIHVALNCFLILQCILSGRGDSVGPIVYLLLATLCLVYSGGMIWIRVRGIGQLFGKFASLAPALPFFQTPELPWRRLLKFSNVSFWSLYCLGSLLVF